MNKSQFIVAMHLINRRVNEKLPLPLHLPEKLRHKLTHGEQLIEANQS